MESDVFGAVRGERVEVLHADLDLADRLDPERRARAAPLSVAAVLRREVGPWSARRDAAAGRSGFGLLVIDGMLVRRVGLKGRYGAELVSTGDLVQPWEYDGEAATLPFEATWRVLSRLRMAVLDLGWAGRMAPFPEIAAEITSRVMARSRRLATMLAIAHFHRLEDRLELLLWELADRYGRVTPAGVVLELRLTHELLSYLSCARRSSVSTALTRLERDGRVKRDGRRWILLGEPPLTTEFIGASDEATGTRD
jgi:hypothetical protein